MKIHHFRSSIAAVPLPVPLAVCLAVGLAAALTSPLRAAEIDEHFLGLYKQHNLQASGDRQIAFGRSHDSVNPLNLGLELEIPIGQRYQVGAGLSYQIMLRYSSSIWDHDEQGSVVSVDPDAESTAGLGWRVDFGRLLSPAENAFGRWIYVSPAGELSRFYDQLNGEQPVAGVYYSHDERRLRLRLNAAGTQAFIDQPNGQTDKFIVDGSGWRFYQRTDFYGNYFRLSYNASNDRFTISDSLGRHHKIFHSADPAGHYPRLVDRIRVDTFGETTASYHFRYDTATVSRPPSDNDPSTPATVTIPRLTALEPPVGNGYAFSYFAAGVAAGRLAGYTQPLLGEVAYTYQDVAMPYPPNAAGTATLQHFAADLVGVASRTTADPWSYGSEQSGSEKSAVIGAWTFSQSFDIARSAPPSLSQPRVLTTEVVHPDGTKFKYFSTVAIKDESIPAPKGSYVLYKNNYGWPVGTGAESRPSWEVEEASGAAVRRRSLQLENPCPSCLDAKERVLREDMLYLEDGAVSESVIYSSFDWAGRARIEQQTDSWGNTPSRTTTRSFSPAMPAAASPWVHGPALTESVAQGLDSKTRHHCIDAGGSILRTRILEGSVEGTGDVLLAYELDGSGHRIRTRYHGGDTQALSTDSDLCALSLPAAWYTAYTDYQYGTVSGQGYLNALGAVVQETMSATVDAHTGLVTSRSRGDDLSVDYAYDKLGRLLSITPPPGQGGLTAIVYTDATPSSPFEIESTLTEQASSAILSRTTDRFSAFGQKVSSSQLGPGGTATTQWLYDARGFLVSRTDPGGHRTQYAQLDAFGRPTVIIPPEGAVHQRTLGYRGLREVTTSWQIAKGAVANPPAQITRTQTVQNDRYGNTVSRLTSDGDGSSMLVTRTYDLRDQWVTHTQQADGESLTRTNEEAVDNRGFLTLDAAGNHLSYDARGLPVSSFHAGGGEVTISRDAAGRVVQEHNLSGQLLREFAYASQNAPGEHNKGKLVTATRYNRGLPHVADGVIKVVETTRYAGKGGRKSSRTTELQDVDSLTLFSVTSSGEYDDAGEIVTVHYPTCSPMASFSCGSPNYEVEEVSYERSFGRLTSVHGRNAQGQDLSWMHTVTYDSHNRRTSYRSGNGLRTQIFPHDHGQGRVEKVVVKNGTQLIYNTGPTTYDGADNLFWLAGFWMPEGFYDLRIYDPQVSDPPAGNQTVDAYGLVIADYENCDETACVMVHVYGPDNRLLWQRFRQVAVTSPVTDPNGHSALFLTDIRGRSVNRARTGSVYEDLFDFNSALSSTVVFANRNSIYADGEKVATQHYASPTYNHVDFKGHVIGSSDGLSAFTVE